MVNSDGLKPARVGPRLGKTCLCAPTLAALHRRPWLFEQTVKNPGHYFHYNTCYLLWHSHYVINKGFFVIVFIVVTTLWQKYHRHRRCVLKDLFWRKAKICHKRSDEKCIRHKIYDALNHHKRDPKMSECSIVPLPRGSFVTDIFVINVLIWQLTWQ